MSSTTTTNRRREVVPQTKQAPKQDSAEAAADAQWLELVAAATEGDSPGARQVKRAIELERQINDLRTKVNDNRTYLRLMDRNDELTDEQGTFVDVFYAEKERGERRTEEEAAATNRARRLARTSGQA